MISINSFTRSKTGITILHNGCNVCYAGNQILFSVFRIILNHYVTTNTAGAYKCYCLLGTWNAFTSSCETVGFRYPVLQEYLFGMFLKQQEIEQFKVHKEFDKIFESVHHQNGLDQVLYAEFQSKMVNDYLLTDDRSPWPIRLKNEFLSLTGI